MLIHKHFFSLALVVALILSLASLTPETKAAADYVQIQKDMAQRIALDQQRQKTGPLQGTAERIEPLSISETQCRGLSSAQLLELCLQNPFHIIVTAYDNPQDGLKFIAEHYAPLAVFLKRADAPATVKTYVAKHKELEGADAVCKSAFLEALRVRLAPVTADQTEFGLRSAAETVLTPRGTSVPVFYIGRRTVRRSKIRNKPAVRCRLSECYEACRCNNSL